MAESVAKRLPLIPLSLGVVLALLGVQSTLTPHVVAVGVFGSISSALTIRYARWFKPLAMSACILYLMVFLWIAMAPGSLFTTWLGYAGSALSVFSLIGLATVGGG